MRGWWLALSYEAPSIFCSSTNKREDVDGYEHCIYWFIIISIHYIFICITLSDAHMVICPKISFLSDQKIMAAPLMDFKGSFFSLPMQLLLLFCLKEVTSCADFN